MISHDLDVLVVGGGPNGVALAARLDRSDVRDLLLVERGQLVDTWDSSLAGTSPTRTGIHFSDTITPGDSQVGSLADFAGGVLTPRQLAEDELPKEVFQSYYRAVADAAGLRYRVGCAVEWVEPLGRGFRVQLSDGEQLTTRTVVDATGVVDSKRWPVWAADLPPERCHHSIGHGVLNSASGLRLVLVGGGHATPDIAVRMAENGSDVTVVVRKPRLQRQLLPYPREYLSGRFQAHYRHLTVHRRLLVLASMAQAGPWVTPRSFTDFTEAVSRPAGRGSISVELSSYVRSARMGPGGIEVDLSNGSRIEVDHVICATGFQAALPDVGGLPLPPGTWSGRTLGGYPLLTDGYEVVGMPGYFLTGYLAQMGPRGPIDAILAGTAPTTDMVAGEILAGRTACLSPAGRG